MIGILKLVSLLKITNGSCIRCCKHTKAKINTSKTKKKYTNTILLPKTEFQVWLDGFKRIAQDEKVLEECGFAGLYNWQRQNVMGPEFVLHDGPPYANGLPHMGHTINKVLKDITVRHKLLQGHRVHFRPGWDCHGLPIELKAVASHGKGLSPLEIRKEARKFAKDAIRNQKAVFRSWGVMADWENGCYYTFDKSYIKNQFQQFYNLYKKGLIYRDFKPVYWSPSSRTALAEAELKYKEDHLSTSTYIRVRVTGAPAAWGNVHLLLWTTTPWTLPANQAVAFNATLPYSLVTVGRGEERYIVATPLIEQIASTLKKELTVVGVVDGNIMSTLRYEHPLTKNQLLPLVPGDHVTATKGTGLVHIAPAHGPDDFKLGRKYNLPITSSVDESGCFSQGAGPELGGLNVLTAGTARVVELCRESGVLVHTHMYKHSFPYDWRTGQPVIQRASQQWFFDTAAVKEQAVSALRGVKVVPEGGLAGFLAQVETRPFWCISRQRVWGVPVPMLYTSDDHPVISQELLDHYCQLLESQGDDFWWSTPISDLAPSNILAKMDVDSSSIKRGQDILDIWLDSGLSWSAVLDVPSADLYLEGVDQFNGWFQSSLMTSVALQGLPPYKTVFVHGFAVDETGLKMSKSVGNVVNPQHIVSGGPDHKKQPVYGVDILRWWVAAHATQHINVPVSTVTLEDSKVCVQKLRSVIRFLLGGLHSLPLHVAPPKLRHLDLYMLHCLHALESQVVQQYNQFQYNRVCSTITNFVTNQVSAVYCYLTKDRLYCEAEDSERRRAVQLTLYHTLSTLTRLIAPIVPVLAEEVYMHQPNRESECLSHLVGLPTRPEWHNPHVEDVVQLAFEVKQQVVKLCPLNCTNWQLAAEVSAPTPQWHLLQLLQDTEESSDSELAEILQVSHVTLRCADSEPDMQVQVEFVKTFLCERCRKHTASVPEQPCPRCASVLTGLD